MKRLILTLALLTSACESQFDKRPTGGTITGKAVDGTGHTALTISWCTNDGQCYKGEWPVNLDTYTHAAIGSRWGSEHPKVVTSADQERINRVFVASAKVFLALALLAFLIFVIGWYWTRRKERPLRASVMKEKK